MVKENVLSENNLKFWIPLIVNIVTGVIIILTFVHRMEQTSEDLIEEMDEKVDITQLRDVCYYINENFDYIHEKEQGFNFYNVFEKSDFRNRVRSNNKELSMIPYVEVP